jgi:hypothetical protein
MVYLGHRNRRSHVRPGRRGTGDRLEQASTEAALDKRLDTAMQVTRQHLVDMLRRAGSPDVADVVIRELPDPVDFDHAATFLQAHGFTRDQLISQMGGNP